MPSRRSDRIIRVTIEVPSGDLTPVSVIKDEASGMALRLARHHGYRPSGKIDVTHIPPGITATLVVRP